MKAKFRIPKVSEYSSVGIMKEWVIELGGEFKENDPIYIIDNLGDEHIIRAKKDGVLLEKLVYENEIIENNQVVGIYNTIPKPEGEKTVPKVKVGGIFSRIFRID